MTTDDDELDDESLRSMRTVWLSMRDEEPPAAGMSALLAAAAEKADSLRDESQPWWQRAFAFLRRPPALAFATVMILIGGAVLVTRTSDKKTASEVASPTPTLEARELQMGSGAATQPMIEEQRAKNEVEKPTETLPPPPPPPVVQKPPVVKPKTKPASETTSKPEPTRNDRFEDDKEKKPEPQKGLETPSDISGTTLDTPSHSSGKKPSNTGPGFGGQDAESTVKDESTPTTDTGVAEPTKPQTPPTTAPPTSPPTSPTSSIEQLARQAESAATRGDCAAVKAIVARIKQQSAAFFKTRLGKTAAVTKCL